MGGAPTSRGRWGSSFGFVLAGAGSAIGLGNIWRFPYVTGTQGGAAFVLLYLACIAVICLPYLLAEMTVGRATGRNPVGAFRALRASRAWPLVGGLAIVTALCIFSYYAVIAGWALGHAVVPLVAAMPAHGEFVASAGFTVPLLAVFVALTGAVVWGGVEHGIERWSRVLMPVMLGLILIIALRGITLDGAGAGVAFLLQPDFDAIEADTLVAALGQAFYSLSLGMGAMITYGSYLDRDADIPRAGAAVAMFDTGIAVLAGFMIFPALFALGHDPASGPTLLFEVLPSLFDEMPLGGLCGPLFFALLCIAALSSTVSLLEVGVSYCGDELGWTRRLAVPVLCVIVFVLGLPSALSKGAVDVLGGLTLLGAESFLDVMDFVWGNVSLAVVAMLTCVFVGWVWGTEQAGGELACGSAAPRVLVRLWGVFVRWVCPLSILAILLTLFGVDVV